MADVDMQVDLARFEEALIRYKTGTGKTWREVIQEQARLLLQRLVALTPPGTRGQGNRAIERDVRRVFVDAATAGVRIAEVAKWRQRAFEQADLGDFQFRSSRIQKLWEKRDWETLEIIFARSDARRFDWSETATRQQHEAARVKGRVPRGSRRKLVVPDVKEIMKLTRELQRDVGIAKAGWIGALLAVGGRVPGWLGRQTKQFGDHQDATGKLIDPQFTAANTSKPMIGLDQELQLAQKATAGRAQAMIRRLEVHLELEARKAGFDT
jgi:hypothetical protein